MDYGTLIPKVIALIQQWRRRFLTPIGRITVIKTLLIPKLNHLFISIPNPKKEIVSLLYKAMFESSYKTIFQEV